MDMGYQGQQNQMNDLNQQGQFQQSRASAVPQFPLEELKKYFAPKKSPKAGITFLVIGILFCVGVLCNAPALLVVGLPLIAIGVYLLANLQPHSKITDEEYERWVKAQLDVLIIKSLDKLDLDRNERGERKPLILRSFVLSPSGTLYTSDSVRWKIGKDGRPHFSVNVFTIFWKEDHHLAVYRGDVVALNPHAHTERTWEYFYTDIVGATTNDVQVSITIGKNQYPYRLRNFSMRVNSGESIDATVDADPIDNRQDLPRFHLPESGVDETLAQIRSLLREKKQTKM
ncbi:MAG TPA: hypothetical protein VNG51_29700 [Ktedonobacteraceae bacterium]|nr:hypothetical protein [Ktedonobacteraceae bacterium]